MLNMEEIVMWKIFALLSYHLVVTAASNTTLTALQSSTLDDFTADLAIDGNTGTCSRTGFEVGGWWKVDLGERMTVSALEIQGSAAAINVRVGDQDHDIGLRRGFDDNTPCIFMTEPLSPAATTTATCNRPVTGRYVSIQAVNSLGSAWSLQLLLCEVKIVLA